MNIPIRTDQKMLIDQAFEAEPDQDPHQVIERAFAQLERGEFFTPEESKADMRQRKAAWLRRHSIGIYVPTKPEPSQADLEVLRVAGERMQEPVAAAGTSEDEVVADFKRARRERWTPEGLTDSRGAEGALEKGT